jgi:hypothetical protein
MNDTTNHPNFDKQCDVCGRRLPVCKKCGHRKACPDAGDTRHRYPLMDSPVHYESDTVVEPVWRRETHAT